MVFLAIQFHNEHEVNNQRSTKTMAKKKTKKEGLYRAIIKHIFNSHFKKGMTEFEFNREEITDAAVSFT